MNGNTTISYPAIVGFTISQLRKARGLGQGQLAEALAVGQSGYSKLERGVRVLSVTQLRVIAAELGVTEQRIYDLSGTLREAAYAGGQFVVDEKAREDESAATTAALEKLWSDLELDRRIRARRSGSDRGTSR